MQVSNFNVDDLVVDLFYWFVKSTKRKAGLVEYCTFSDIHYRDIGKHVNTRWLSLERGVLQQYDGLRSYFLFEGIGIMACTYVYTMPYMFNCYVLDDRSPRFQRLHRAFTNPMTEIYLLFYESALQTFIKFNTFLQREDPLIPIICEQMDSFLTKLASKFVPVCAITAANGDFSRM